VLTHDIISLSKGEKAMETKTYRNEALIERMKRRIEESKKRDKEFFEWALNELDRQKNELQELEKELREG
jgi:CCR4-NOT transcriptional regulation complex NOT5 subunit